MDSSSRLLIVLVGLLMVVPVLLLVFVISLLEAVHVMVKRIPASTSKALMACITEKTLGYTIYDSITVATSRNVATATATTAPCDEANTMGKACKSSASTWHCRDFTCDVPTP